MHNKKLQVLTQKFTKTVSLFCEIFNTFAEDGGAKYFCNFSEKYFLLSNMSSRHL